MRRKDVFLVLGILLTAIIIFLINSVIDKKESEAIEIYVDNKLYKSIPIDGEEEIVAKYDNNYNCIKIYDMGVEMIEASCPDKVCVKSGFIKNASEKIVCIPNKVIVKIKTSKNTNNSADVISK